MNFEEKIRIKNKLISIKDLICSLPLRYEYKKFIEFPPHPNVLYKFNFTKRNIISKDGKIFVNGYVKNQELTVIHSSKLYKLFHSYDNISLIGKIQNDSCFYPSILKHLTAIDELSPVYSSENSSLEYYIHKHLENLPGEMKNIFSQIHKPVSEKQINLAIEKLALYEVGLFIKNLKTIHKPKIPNRLFEIQSPYKLTEDQSNTFQEIQKDFQKDYRTIRLIHGEVGSGKTLIAFVSAMTIVQNNKKVYIMAPTILLAEQIYEFFSKNNYLNAKITLIKSKIKKKETDADIFIGTQALLFKEEIPNIGLLIIDEQHKFGVLQRNKLIYNNNADLLMLSATPIPRTFQMVTKGYLEYSTLKQTSIGGKKHTFIRDNDTKTIKEMIEIAKENKVVWVCKTIELAEKRFEEFKKSISNCFLIHSKINEKNDILSDFDKLEYGILISTTVIEVGIDIDLRFIFIEDADKFGLAQIHQLRGRIARRPNTVGYCVLIGSNKAKLQSIKNSDDGFAITKLDSKMRGGGLLHGTSQSGFESFFFTKILNNLKFINMQITDDFIKKATQTDIPESFLKLFHKVYTTEILS